MWLIGSKAVGVCEGGAGEGHEPESKGSQAGGKLSGPAGVIVDGSLVLAELTNSGAGEKAATAGGCSLGFQAGLEAVSLELQGGTEVNLSDRSRIDIFP